MKRSTSNDYLQQLQALLPVGLAWPRENGTVVSKILHSFAEGYSRIHNSFLDIIEEADPRTTIFMLPRWEWLCGILNPQESLQARRNEVITKLLAKGGQSVAYFKSLAVHLGYDIDLIEHHPFVCGVSECGGTHECGDETLNFFWQVVVKGQRIVWFQAGESLCGDTLAEITEADDLETLLHKYKPAQTHLIVGYQ